MPSQTYYHTKSPPEIINNACTHILSNFLRVSAYFVISDTKKVKADHSAFTLANIVSCPEKIINLRNCA